MGTAKKIKEIPNGSELEVLAAPILRRINSDYTYFIQTGINSLGQSIKDPVDGIVRVEKNGIINFIYFEFTIDKNLNTKWLKDLSDYKGIIPKTVKDGDILKVVKLANDLKADFPDSIFRICLCTNQEVSSQLVTQVSKKCKALGIECDPIIEFTNLVDYLENTPHGHWLRKKYLGIEAQLLSLELLDSVCSQTLKDYKIEINYDESTIIDRDISNEFQNCLKNDKKPITFLTGDSGVGKSILIYQTFEKFNQDAFILRIRNKYLQTANSLNHAIHLQIKEHIPNIFQTPLQNIFKLIGNKSMFLVVEDINSAGNSCSYLLKKILDWSSHINSSTNSKDSSFRVNSIKIICPVWSKYFSDFLVTNPKIDNYNFEKFKLDRYSEKEALVSLKKILCSANISLATPQIKIIASNLNFDPFLIGIYQKLVVTPKGDYLAQANRALEKFIDKEIIEVSIECYLPSYTINSALNHFATLLLQKRTLTPHQDNALKWFNGRGNQLKIFYSFCQRGNLFKSDKEGNIIFRHDRIRDAILIRALLRMIDNFNDNSNILEEPFYTDIIGQAISKNQISDRCFDFFLEKNPLSLFIALQYFDGNKNDYFENYIYNLDKWLKSKLLGKFLDNNLIWELSKAIYKVDLPEVLNLTKHFSKVLSIHACNFRNGKISGGISFIARFIRSDFEPASGNIFRDELFEIAKTKYYNGYEDQLIHCLKSENFGEGQEFFRNAIILLSGYWQSEKLSEHILSCWMNSENKSKSLSSAIWAVIHSESKDLENHLFPLLKYWVKCPKSKLAGNVKLKFDQNGIHANEDDLDYRKETKRNLSRCRWKNLKKKTIESLINLTQLNKEFEELLSGILMKIDSPTSLEFTIPKISQNYKKATELDNTMFFLSYDYFIRSYDPNENRDKQLSSKSLNYLSQIWIDKNNDEYQRLVAFQIWDKNSGIQELSSIKKISLSDNPRIVRTAIKKRIALGDKSVIELLPEYFQKEDIEFHQLENIWCPELLDVIKNLFEDLAAKYPEKVKNKSLPPPYGLMGCIKKLSSREVERFYDEFWKYSGKTPEFFLIALLVGTPKLIQMSKLSIENAENPKEYFKYISLHYGFWINPDEDYITKRSLENLLEYSKYLSMKEFESIAECCQRKGFVEWSRKNILPHLGLIERVKWSDQDTPRKDDLASEFFPSHKNIKQILKDESQFKRLHHISKDFVQRFERKGINDLEFFRILKKWLIENPTSANYKVAAKCIEVSGVRDDLDLLDIAVIDSDPLEISRIKNESTFILKRRTLK